MTDTTKYKEALEQEYVRLTQELTELGVPNPHEATGWDVKVPDMDIMNADENEAADRSEETQIDAGILDELAIRHKNVARALKKIEEGTYGFCEISNEPIEDDRLEANPAARTCKTHIEEETKLEQ